MRNTMMLAALLGLTGMLAAPAYSAGCEDSVKAVEESAADITDASKKAEVQKHIAEAKSHLAMGHEDVCEQHVAAARGAMTDAGDMPAPERM